MTLDGRCLEIKEQKCKNSLAMEISVYHVILDGITIAECRDPYWANYLVNAIRKESDEPG